MIMGKITIIVNEVTKDGIKLTIPHQEGIIGDYEKYRNKLSNEVFLNLNETFELYLDVYDAMESWELSLVKMKDC